MISATKIVEKAAKRITTGIMVRLLRGYKHT